MRRLLLIAAICVSMGAPLLADISISHEYAIATDGTLTCPLPGAIVDNFDSARPGWTYSLNGAVVGPGDGYIGGTQTAAAPYNPVTGVDDATQYYTVPLNVSTSPQSATVYFGGGTYNYLGLFWGSMDTYNQIDFYLGDYVTPVATVTGSMVTLDGASGNQQDELNNAYVNIYGLPTFDRVKFTSSQYAFEFDNLAVPVPGAVLLGLFGLGAAGLKLRKHA